MDKDDRFSILIRKLSLHVIENSLPPDHFWSLTFAQHAMRPESFIPKDVIIHLSDDQFAIFLIDLSKFLLVQQ